MKQIWIGLPTYAKGIIAVFLVGAGGFAVWKGYKYIVKIMDTSGERAENSETKDQISKLKKDGMKPSYSDAQYAQWANQLKEAFAGCGTSNGTWANIYGKLKNDLDVLLLNKAYGTRKFDSCNWEFDFGDFEGTLSQALVHELSDAELQMLNKSLAAKKITASY